MTFLYPTAGTFPFDETCSNIVRLIESRNWNVPNIKLEFSEYQGNRMVRYITGPDFKLYFCRIQGSLGNGWNNIAAVNEITVMDTTISVYSDGSGPSMKLYVGNDFKKEPNWIHDDLRLLRNESRRTIKYRGSCHESGSYFRNHENIYLVANSDLGRDYLPEPLHDGQIPHRAHEWSIDNDLANDVPKCVLVSKVFHWINEELKKRLSGMEENNQ
jgi:hypothetical protein